MNIFIMHPRGRVAPLQERQMTTVLDPNVFNLALEGTFDDCQRIMKSIFRDLAFKQAHALGAVNSVNWARVLAQIVYYFSAGLYVMKEAGADRVRFSVPTGNFGDILAGYYARRMGLPIRNLVLATNENDILSRFFETGIYQCGKVVKTLSPSMDIQVASNFERYLYYRMGQDSERVRDAMFGFRDHGVIDLVLGDDVVVDDLFRAGVGTTKDVLETIQRYDQVHDYVLDPHTAVGVAVAERHLGEDDSPMVCLATAHPAKFSAAIEEATGKVVHHETLDALMEAPTRLEVLPADENAVRDYIAAHALA
jgi:threonine synthase